jgi:ribonuclease J
MIHRTINRLFQRGADVIYDAIAPVHVSGHAKQEEMKFLLRLVKPTYLIPIHGELRHLKQHAALARGIGFPKDQIAVIENGRVIEFSNGKMKIASRVPGGYVFVDGSGVGDIGRRVMREREVLARDGFVAVHLSFDNELKQLQRDPEIVSKGFVFVRDAGDIFDQARKKIRDIVSKNGGTQVREKIERDLSKLFYAETKRRPMVLVFITETGKGD